MVVSAGNRITEDSHGSLRTMPPVLWNDENDFGKVKQGCSAPWTHSQLWVVVVRDVAVALQHGSKEEAARV